MKHDKKLCSIVTISYNQAEFLEQAILSVLEQDYPNIEYIVVDPGSKDGSRDIIDRYRRQISSVIFEPDHGPADGLNKGFALARGDVFGFLNSDDFLLPGSISNVMNYFQQHRNVDVLSGHGYYVDKFGSRLKGGYSHRINRIVYGYGAGILFQQSTYFSRKSFERAGGFNVQNHTSWDGELWADMLLTGARFARINKYLSAFRIHSASITGSRSLEAVFLKDQERVSYKLLGRKSSYLPTRFLWILNRLSDPALLWLQIRNKISLN